MESQDLKQNSFVDFAIEDLIKQGTLAKTVTLNDKITVTLKGLTQEDRENFSKLIKLPEDSTDANTLYATMELSKVPILVYAISKINNIDYSSAESKSALYTLLKKFPAPVIDRLYYAHLENEDNLIKLFKDSDVKKKS